MTDAKHPLALSTALTTYTNALALGLEHGAVDILERVTPTTADLKELYQQVAPDALLVGTRLAEVSAPKHAHPKYCFKMATGTGKTWVLQALLIRCAANPAVQGRVKSADGKAVLVDWIGFNAASAAARCTSE